jgi:hypothetical protein
MFEVIKPLVPDDDQIELDDEVGVTIGSVHDETDWRKIEDEFGEDNKSTCDECFSLKSSITSITPFE